MTRSSWCALPSCVASRRGEPHHTTLTCDACYSWDMRDSSGGPSQTFVRARVCRRQSGCVLCLATDARLSWQADHDSEVNALDFNPFNEFLLVTCSGHVRSFTCSGALFCVGIVDVRCVLCSRRFTCGILAKPRRRCTRSRATQMRCSKRSGPPSTKRFAFTTTQGTGTIPSLTVCACCVHVVCVCVCVCVRTDPGIERIRPPCQRVGYRQDRCRAERRGR